MLCRPGESAEGRGHLRNMISAIDKRVALGYSASDATTDEVIGWRLSSPPRRGKLAFSSGAPNSWKAARIQD